MAWILATAAVALLAPQVGLAQAQEGGQEPRPQMGASQDLAGLHLEAIRLSILNVLPEEARTQAEELFGRFMQFQARAQEQEVAWLQAYVEALRAGEAPAVAAAMAHQQGADAQLELVREREELRTEIAAFLADNLEAVIALAVLAHDFHSGGGTFGPGGGFPDHGRMSMGYGHGMGRGFHDLLPGMGSMMQQLVPMRPVTPGAPETPQTPGDAGDEEQDGGQNRN